MSSPDPGPSIRLYTYAMSPFAAKVHCFLHYEELNFGMKPFVSREPALVPGVVLERELP